MGNSVHWEYPPYSTVRSKPSSKMLWNQPGKRDLKRPATDFAQGVVPRTPSGKSGTTPADQPDAKAGYLTATLPGALTTSTTTICWRLSASFPQRNYYANG